MEEQRELEALRAENATLRAERARSKTQVSASRSPQTSAQTPISAPRKMITRVPDDEGVSIQDFLKLRTPEFRGEEGEDPQEFLEETEKMTRRLTCSETRVIELIGINLKSNAWEWYKRTIEDRLYKSNSPTWEEFKKLLMNEYLPPAERHARAYQFEKLKQLPGMTVAEYAKEFSRLRKYAPQLVPTEADRVERFRAGLIRPIYNSVLATDFPTLSALVDKAKRWESKRDEEKQEREQLKKVTGRGQEGKGGKEETEATAKAVSKPPLYPYKGGKKRRKGPYRRAPVSSGNYMTTAPATSPGVGRTWQTPRPMIACGICGKLHKG